MLSSGTAHWTIPETFSRYTLIDLVHWRITSIFLQICVWLTLYAHRWHIHPTQVCFDCLLSCSDNWTQAKCGNSFVFLTMFALFLFSCTNENQVITKPLLRARQRLFSKWTVSRDPASTCQKCTNHCLPHLQHRSERIKLLMWFGTVQLHANMRKT